MSVEQAVMRISQIQAALAPPPAIAPPPAGGAGGTDFASVLGARTSALGGGAAIGGISGPAGGSVGARMVALARQEVGVAEQPPGSNNSPRIAEYRQATAGSGIGPWCAYFTSWLAKSSGAPVGEQGQGFGSVDALYAWAQRTGRATQNGPGVRPQAGDMIVWDEHIGLVESVDPDGTVHTIEGNSSDQVIRRTHAAGSALGYVHLG